MAKAIVGRNSLAGTGAFNYMNPLLFALPASIIVFVIATFLTKPSSTYQHTAIKR